MVVFCAISFSLGLLVPLSAPPPLNNPVFSLATVGENGLTNMNILTYASPIGITPRRWVISLVRKSETHRNFAKRRGGVLQLLMAQHGPLIYTLGGCSARDVDKEEACRQLGFQWKKFDGVDEWLIDDCAVYYRLSMEGDFINAGEHDAAICRLDEVLISDRTEGPAEEALSTGDLRALGLVTDTGRAVEP
ncbi:hypothetical protein AB1Y20_004042 [Prymnesium parvum]|uniref:Flavin reductase like domain-containing protein n=1 Tax=Prymnesium parvum TaxID=97485 RepID=A0AB34J8T8_PRYPA